MFVYISLNADKIKCFQTVSVYVKLDILSSLKGNVLNNVVNIKNGITMNVFVNQVALKVQEHAIQTVHLIKYGLLKDVFVN